VRYEYDSECQMTTMRRFSSAHAMSTPQKFDVSGYRSASSAAILIYPNGGSGQTPDYQPASTGLYFWKRFDHAGSDSWGLVDLREDGPNVGYDLPSRRGAGGN
jgi:hypothetical protein